MSRRDSGRGNQKLRTRQALLEAARRLVAEGREPGIEQVADAALVSRATAYRYFPSAEALLLEAALDQAMRPMQEIGLGDLTDPVERVGRVQDRVTAMVIANEPAQRLYLAAVLREARDGFRGGRRLAVLEEALRPARAGLGEAAHARLLAALGALCGAEALTTLTDVCGLGREEAAAVLGWAARALTATALAEAGERADG